MLHILLIHKLSMPIRLPLLPMLTLLASLTVIYGKSIKVLDPTVLLVLSLLWLTMVLLVMLLLRMNGTSSSKLILEHRSTTSSATEILKLLVKRVIKPRLVSEPALAVLLVFVSVH